MYGDFYTTTAQTMPLLLLALVWDSAYLERLRGQRRLKRTEDPGGVRFWTKPRVRVYTIFVAAVAIVATAVTLLVLGGMLPDSLGLRITLACALIIVLATLLTRIFYEVVAATTSQPDHPAPDADRSALSAKPKRVSMAECLRSGRARRRPITCEWLLSGFSPG